VKYSKSLILVVLKALKITVLTGQKTHTHTHTHTMMSQGIDHSEVGFNWSGQNINSKFTDISIIHKTDLEN
jgi:hypothetical protein